MTELLRRRIIGIHDDTVREKTGLNWADWFKVLDKAGGRMMDHPNITAYLRRQHGLTKWWSQTVTSGYEQERGIRQKHQKGTKFSVDISKIIAAPLAAVWAAWSDRAMRERWLPGVSFEVRSFVQDKIMHLEWPDGTKVDVALQEKGGRTRTVVTHGRLPEQADIERVRPYWTEALERLRSLAEG